MRLSTMTLVLALSVQPATNSLCGSSQPSPSPAPAPTPTPTPTGEVFTTSDGTRFGVETVAANLQIPWSLAFAPDGRLFVTERPGRVRIVRSGTLLAQAALTIGDVAAQGEAGLLGIAVHPAFATNRFVYLVYTAQRGTGSTIVNRLVRYRELNDTLSEGVVLLDNIAAASIHDGSRLRFGPDGKLYMTMGDASAPQLSQDLASLNGKVLRLNDDGTTPGDNPYGSPVYSSGHRNPQGFDWHPQSGDLWETEHGQTGNDEVNLIERARNYGWPVIEGTQTMTGMDRPILLFSPSIAPSGAAFYNAAAFPAFRQNFFFATLRGEHLRRVRFDAADARRVASEERLLEGRFGRLRDVVVGPDGALYICTSNRDGRGSPASDDDRVLRLVPR